MKTFTRALAALLALTLAVAACSSDSDDAAPDPTENPGGQADGDTGDDGGDAPAADAVIEVTSVNLATSEVVLTNNGTSDVDLAGWWLCNRPSYVELSGTLAAGESLTFSDPGLPLDPAAGEVGVYRSQEFGSPSAIASYVAWGTPGPRASVAVEAGVWTEGDAVIPAGDTISATGAGATSAADWG